MSISMMSARHFARDLAEAKDMANKGPVIVTARGKPAYALLSIEDYYALSHVSPSTLLEMMDGLSGRLPDPNASARSHF
ncbi:MAG: type II toxin-antitoxin system prevent-host-death family antitoxin [Zoogloeaceae bacterium]|jgi:prevent-host-death family protein|nr:type II toxin-antitoxin system prevent-host-death family antitoxin [Zoogloeaceae bacterium]